VDVRGIRDFYNLVALHDIDPHPGHPGVGLVVHEQIAAIVGSVRERHVRVMQIAIQEYAASALQMFPGFGQQALGEYLPAFVGLAPARRAAAIEHRHAHQFTH
jgi:hypothetical protein